GPVRRLASGCGQRTSWPGRGRSSSSWLFELYVGVLDHLGPLGVLGGEQRGQLFRGAADGDATLGGVGIDHFLAVQRIDGGGVDLLAIGERRLAGRDQRIPVVGVDLGQAELARGRHVGQQRRAGVGGDRQRLHRAGADVGQRHRYVEQRR